MPKSKVRAKKPHALRGVPASVVAQIPPNLTSRQQAEWIRAYRAGTADGRYDPPRGSSVRPQLRRAVSAGRTNGTSEEARAIDDRDRLATARGRRFRTIAGSDGGLMLRIEGLARTFGR